MRFTIIGTDFNGNVQEYHVEAETKEKAMLLAAMLSAEDAEGEDAREQARNDFEPEFVYLGWQQAIWENIR